MAVLVRPPGCDDASCVRQLETGQHLRFGRGAPDVDVDLVIGHAGVSRLAGEVVAGPSYWFLTNFSARSVYLVENLESPLEYVRVAPGREGLPVPFEMSSVVIPAERQTVAFQVFAPSQPTMMPAYEGGLPGERTATSFPLDRSAKYFLVLVALCEPRLRGDALAPLPTVPQICERVRPLAGCEELTPRAVDFHLDYLSRMKLRLRAGDDHGRRQGRREVLAAFALRFGLVEAGHLHLLPARRPRTTGGPT